MVLSNELSPQLKEYLDGFEKKFEERLARFEVAIAKLEAFIDHRNETQAAINKRREAAAIRKAAAVAAQEARPFDMANIYGTLINPRGRVKDVLVEFSTAAAEEYKEMDNAESVLSTFVADFKHWDESHFRSLPKKETAKLREVLMEKEVPIRAGRFPAFRALSQIIRNANRSAGIAVAAIPAATDMAAADANTTNSQVRPEMSVEVNGTSKVNTVSVSSPMSPPAKEQRAGNTTVAM